MEQYYRDLRISAIYEGTTGIQALDLVGRKMTTANGRLFMTILGKFGQLYEANKDHPRLGPLFARWKEAYDKMTECGMTFTEMIKERGLSGAVLYATPFMFLFSTVTAAYFFLKQGLIADQGLEQLKADNSVSEQGLAKFIEENGKARFYDTKLKTLDFFINITLTRYQAYAVPILDRNYTALDIAL